MKICHPSDCTLERVASGVVLKATCHALRCGRLYARLVDRAMPLQETEAVFLALDSWSSYLSVKRLVDEMICHDSGFCDPCATGTPMQCQGIPSHARTRP